MSRLLKAAYAAGIYLFLYLPLVVLIVFSFNDSRLTLAWKGFTLSWYVKLLGNRTLLDAALNSLTVAALSACIATVAGTLAAVALSRWRFPGRKSLSAVMYVVMMSPDIVMALSLLVLFVSLGLPLGFGTLLTAHVTFCIPFVTVTVLSRLSGFDWGLMEAAMDLGASEAQAFRRVILPLAAPAVAAGWLMSFTLSLDDVIISFFTTGPTYEVLPLRIYSMVRLGVKPEVNALCTVMIGLTLAAVAVSHLLLRERRRP